MLMNRVYMKLKTDIFLVAALRARKGERDDTQVTNTTISLIDDLKIKV